VKNGNEETTIVCATNEFWTPAMIGVRLLRRTIYCCSSSLSRTIYCCSSSVRRTWFACTVCYYSVLGTHVLVDYCNAVLRIRYNVAQQLKQDNKNGDTPIVLANVMVHNYW
jgi:hypothetical protein